MTNWFKKYWNKADVLGKSDEFEDMFDDLVKSEGLSPQDAAIEAFDEIEMELEHQAEFKEERFV